MSQEIRRLHELWSDLTCMDQRSTFGGLRVRLDPWATDYGASLMSGGEPDGWAGKVDVEPGVEMPESDWRPIACDAVDVFARGTVAFVDGVRRMESNLVFEQGGAYLFGGIGCCAAGAVVMTPGRMNRMDEALVRVTVQRYVFAPSGSDLPEMLEFAQDYPPGAVLPHQVVEVSGTDPTEPLRRLQQLMRQEEALTADQVSPEEAQLVIADGPLSLPLLRPGVVGFIKSLHSVYISPELLAVPAALRKHERSPIFRLSGEDTIERYSTYVRIADPRMQDTALAGIARFEVTGSGGLDDARSVLNRCAALVPLFASPYGRDPRAPQNLLPVSALEMELRRRLGNPEILRRIYLNALSAAGME